jgi:predicted TIM-barrel fold metal-dependent hydrolase
MSQVARPTASERVRSRLDHPVIDADGHFVEYFPALAQYLAREGIDDPGALFADVGAGLGTGGFGAMSAAERERTRATVTPWWALPAANTLDLATAMLPRLLHERLDQLGIDFAVMYSSAGLVYPHVRDERLRRGGCRALNRYSADAFADCADRLTPAAVIPMNTPAEAIEELEFATRELGLRAAMIAGFVERPVPDPSRSGCAVWWDTYGIDSAHDYDPFWKRCEELGVSLGSHSGSMGIGFRRSITTYMYNHIGHFGAVGEALAKSLFFGGVTRRFPRLRVGLLEGGVHWAVGLYGDLIARWTKRNLEAVQIYDPRRIDPALFAELLAKHGGALAAYGASRRLVPGDFHEVGPHDDFAHIGVQRAEQIRDLFVPHFYCGCEADDPMTATAFDRTRIPFGAQIRAMFSSDIGHWDVPDMTEVLEEAWENVEHGWLDTQQFRDFVFANVARFYTDTNPRFFEGTAVERAVAELIAAPA